MSFSTPPDRSQAKAGTSGPADPHAEINALRAAGGSARGGTALVTLEPCNHTGRTGPCAQALIEAGIARVVYAVADPTPDANGGGATLAAAACRHRLRPARRRGRPRQRGLADLRTAAAPFVLWKYASTLDGRIAAADGSSRWISSPQSRADVHRLRAQADAVVVGSGTLQADDPQLAARDVEGEVTQPLRVVLDTNARTMPRARVLDGTAPTLIAVAQDASTLHLPGVDIARLPRAQGGIAVHALLTELYGRGVRSVLLEGGPTLAGAFVEVGAVDKVVGYLAPALLGAGPTALGDAGITSIGQALRLDVADVTRIGPDVRITAYPSRPEEN